MNKNEILSKLRDYKEEVKSLQDYASEKQMPSKYVRQDISPIVAAYEKLVERIDRDPDKFDASDIANRLEKIRGGVNEWRGFLDSKGPEHLEVERKIREYMQKDPAVWARFVSEYSSEIIDAGKERDLEAIHEFQKGWLERQEKREEEPEPTPTPAPVPTPERPKPEEPEPEPETVPESPDLMQQRDEALKKMFKELSESGTTYLEEQGVSFDFPWIDGDDIELDGSEIEGDRFESCGKDYYIKFPGSGDWVGFSGLKTVQFNGEYPNGTVEFKGSVVGKEVGMKWSYKDFVTYFDMMRKGINGFKVKYTTGVIPGVDFDDEWVKLNARIVKGDRWLDSDWW